MSLWFATCLATEMTSTNWDLSDEFRRSYETQKTASATLAPSSGGGTAPNYCCTELLYCVLLVSFSKVKLMVVSVKKELRAMISWPARPNVRCIVTLLFKMLKNTSKKDILINFYLYFCTHWLMVCGSEDLRFDNWDFFVRTFGSTTYRQVLL